MAQTNDVDNAILDLANSLISKINDRQVIYQGLIIQLQDIPELLVKLFEYLTSEVIKDDQRPCIQTHENARTLQTIFDTLEEIMNIPMDHITGMGLVSLERRQLFDALQIFSDLIKCCVLEEGQLNAGAGQDKDGFLTLSQLESSPLDCNLVTPPQNIDTVTTNTPTPNLAFQDLHIDVTTDSGKAKTQKSQFCPTKPHYVNQPTYLRPDEQQKRQAGTTSQPTNRDQKGRPTVLLQSRFKSGLNLDGKSIYSSSMSLKRSPFIVGKPRVKSFSTRSQSRRPSVSTRKPEQPTKPPTGNNILKSYSTKAVGRDMPTLSSATTRIQAKYINTSQIYSKRAAVKKNDTTDGKRRKVSIRSQVGEVSSTKARKPSVVSTKVKRYSISSPTNPEKYPRVKRVTGNLSPQTVSLCSSLKMLEEFDYLKRRYKEIQTEIEQHMCKVRELQAEEVRIEYVLQHIQQESTLTRRKRSTNRRRKRSVR